MLTRWIEPVLCCMWGTRALVRGTSAAGWLVGRTRLRLSRSYTRLGRNRPSFPAIQAHESRALRWYKADPSGEFEPEVWSSVLMGLAKTPTVDTDDMERVFSSIPRPSAIHFSSLLFAYALREDSHGAVAVEERMGKAEPPIEPDERFYKTMMTLHLRLGDAAGVERALKRMRTPASAGVLEALLNLHIDDARRDDAHRIVAEMLGMKPPVAPKMLALNKLMHLHALAKDIGMCEGLLRLMARSDPPVVPNVVMYNTLINAYAKRGDAVGSLAVVSRMQLAKPSVKPDKVTLTTLVKLHESRGDAKGSEQFLDWIKFAGTKGKPDTASYTAPMKVYADQGDAQTAEGLLDRMIADGVEPDAYAFTTLMNMYAEKSDREKAEALMDRMVESGVVPDVFVFTALMKLYVKLGDLCGAEGVLEQMDQYDVSPDVVTFNSMIKLYVDHQDERGAEQMLKRMRSLEIDPDVTTFTTLMDLYASTGDAQGARGVLRRMKEHNVKPGELTFVTMMKLYKGGDIDVDSLLDRMARHKVKPGYMTFSTLLRLCADAKDAKGGEAVMGWMEQAGAEPDEPAFRALLSAFTRIRDKKGAQMVIDRAAARGIRL